jgi:predicted RNA-binding protein with PIN domain
MNSGMVKGIKLAAKAMEYWLDGYNLVLRKGWDREGGLEAARARLLRAVTPLGVACRVYFDARGGAGVGGPSREESPSTLVRPLYVKDRPADDAMADDLRAAAKGTVTVVTDDRELRGRAKQLGATTLGVEKFLEKLDHAATPVRKPSASSRARKKEPGATPEAGRDARLSKREVDEWMKLFGFEEGEPGGPKGAAP